MSRFIFDVELASSNLRHTVSILNDYDVPVFVNKTRNGSNRTLAKNKTKCTRMKNKIEYFKEVALKLGHNVVLDIKNNLLHGFTNLWE